MSCLRRVDVLEAMIVLGIEEVDVSTVVEMSETVGEAVDPLAVFGSIGRGEPGGDDGVEEPALPVGVSGSPGRRPGDTDVPSSARRFIAG